MVKIIGISSLPLHKNNAVLRAMLIILLLNRVANARLSTRLSQCPNLFPLIKSVVTTAVSKEARMGASLLRLHFHDCFVNGCDASILLDDTANFTGEKNAFPNANSLRGFEVIDAIKSQVESACPGVVSCADVLAAAAREAVYALGGPSWPVRFGRKDSITASLSDANTNIPSIALNLDGLISAFASKGFTANEMVALSGAHTIGQVRCLVFRGRLYNETNINATFAAGLKSNCPISGGDNNLSPFDSATPLAFDNGYFKNLVSQMGILHSDQQLFNGGSTDNQVNFYSSNSSAFFLDFSNAMVKMGNLSPPAGTPGQIRLNCRKINQIFFSLHIGIYVIVTLSFNSKSQ